MSQFELICRSPYRRRSRTLAFGLVVAAVGALLALGPASLASGSAVLTSATGSSAGSSSAAAISTAFPTLLAGPGGGHSVSTVNFSVDVGRPHLAKGIPGPFWGINAIATRSFTPKASSVINATPVDYVLFPGGVLGEQYNYTSGVITAPNGSQSMSATSMSQFVSTCEQFNCHAILQLPAEIDSPVTDAFYANYVVHTLGFQPTYWEIGNDPSSWTHYKVPWSQWGSKGGGNTTPAGFAVEVGTIIAAVTLVDPGAHFLALGTTDWVQSNGIYYDKSWVSELAGVDGKVLSGIALHSYINGGGPRNPSWTQLFANLHGIYSLSAQVDADRSYIRAACPTCTNLHVFITEINAAQDNSYTNLLTTFAGPLYLAAEVTQGLNLHVSNLDWFCYVCTYQGAWSQGGKNWQMQYSLFSDLLSQLKNETLQTTVQGPWWLMASATFNTTGLSLLMVNVNTSHAAEVNLADSRLDPGANATEYLWKNGSAVPISMSITIGSEIRVPTHSIMLITVGPREVHHGANPAQPLRLPTDHGVSAAVPGSLATLPIAPIGVAANTCFASADGCGSPSSPMPSGFSPIAGRAPEA